VITRRKPAVLLLDDDSAISDVNAAERELGRLHHGYDTDLGT
jgi:hypothetical protein